jgi:hypothetical protein
MSKCEMDWRLGFEAPSTYDVRFIRDLMCNVWDGEWQYGLDGDELVVSLEVGDIFVVNAKEGNSESQEFWVLFCTKLLHKLTNPLKCKWGMKYDVGDEVVEGKYYKKWGNFNSFYVLLKEFNVVCLFSHLVKLVNFLMPPKNYCVFGNDSLFDLPFEVATRIQSHILFICMLLNPHEVILINTTLDGLDVCKLDLIYP